MDNTYLYEEDEENSAAAPLVTLHETQDHQELVQVSYVYYTLAEAGVSRRLTLDLNGSAHNDKRLPPGTFERKTRFQLPLTLTLPYWRRHDYSLYDIEETLHSYKPKHNWQVAQSLGQTVATNATKLSYESEEDLICQAGATAVNNIMAALELKGDWSQTSRLTYDEQNRGNTTPMPVHWVTPAVWAEIKACWKTKTLPVDSHGKPISHGCGTAARSRYTHCFQWSGTRIIPAGFISSSSRLSAADDKMGQASDSTSKVAGGMRRKKAASTTAAAKKRGTKAQQQQQDECRVQTSEGEQEELEISSYNPDACYDVFEMLRVVPERVYAKHCKPATCLVQEPQRYIIGNTLCCAALESFYVALSTMASGGTSDNTIFD